LITNSKQRVSLAETLPARSLENRWEQRSCRRPV
jgi:hypothetical protein